MLYFYTVPMEKEWIYSTEELHKVPNCVSTVSDKLKPHKKHNFEVSRHQYEWVCELNKLFFASCVQNVRLSHWHAIRNIVWCFSDWFYAGVTVYW